MRIGIDIGGTNVRVLAGDDDDKVLEGPIRRSTPATYQALLDLLVMSVNHLSNGHGGPRSIGIGVPGAANIDGPVWVPALPFLDGSCLGSDLTAELRCPVRFANDAQCALVAEAHHGAAKGLRDVALVAVGTGVGGALMYGGQLVRGNHGVAGAFGWLPGPVSPDRRHGPWETTASGTALSDLAARLDLSSTQLVARARAGESEPATLVENYVVELGKGLAAIASVLDPSVIVLAGGLCEAFDVLEPGIKRALRNLASPAGKEVRVVPALIGADAGSVGALLIANAEGTGR